MVPDGVFPVCWKLGANHLSRILLAFRCFFNILFHGELSETAITELHLTRRRAPETPPKVEAVLTARAIASPLNGALQILGILQRDSRLVDFLMEDIAAYSDDQVGAAVRELHDQCRDSLARYVTLEPVIDGVEGTFAKAPSKDPNVVKFVGNVPAKTAGGRHAAPQGLARREGGLARASGRTGRGRDRAGGNRNRVRKQLEPQYVIGIDLGTTNSALAYAEIAADADPFAPANVQLLAVPQLVNPGEVREEELLPSFLYLPGATDFPAGTLALPWDAEPAFVVGRLAQKRGAENAGRLVSSAKSWLSHSGVDRTAPLLPFRAPEGVAKISPVEASRRYLEHLREAWDSQDAGRAVRGAAGAGDGAGVVRRGGARTDAGGRRAGRLSEPDAARRAAGGVLRLDRAARRTGASACRWAI